MSPWSEWLLDAVRAGEVSESAIDGHVLRLLRLAARVGALEGLDPATPPARRWSENELETELRATSAAGMVLIKNDGTLPLEPSSLKKIAVIGPNAATARTLGGGSATVFPSYVVSLLDGLASALGDGVEIAYALGVRSSERTEIAAKQLLQLPDGSGPGAEVIFFAADDHELGRQRRQAAAMMWWGPVQDELTASDIDHVRIATSAAGAGVRSLHGRHVRAWRVPAGDQRRGDVRRDHRAPTRCRHGRGNHEAAAAARGHRARGRTGRACPTDISADWWWPRSAAPK